MALHLSPSEAQRLAKNLEKSGQQPTTESPQRPQVLDSKARKRAGKYEDSQGVKNGARNACTDSLRANRRVFEWRCGAFRGVGHYVREVDANRIITACGRESHNRRYTESDIVDCEWCVRYYPGGVA